MSDLIDRQAAIERFDYIRPRDPMTNDYTHGIDVGIALCKVAIREQPSAQPDIIRCKDCKHWDGVDTCDVIDAPVWDNDFCSMAERRSDEE